jgi:hypothetical protein
MLQTQTAMLRRLTKREPVNLTTVGREIAAAMTEAGRYTI